MYPSSHQFISGPVPGLTGALGLADTGAQREEDNVLRPRNRGKMGLGTTCLLQHPCLYAWDGSRVATSRGRGAEWINMYDGLGTLQDRSQLLRAHWEGY